MKSKKGNIEGYIWAVDVRFEGENLKKINELRDEKKVNNNNNTETESLFSGTGMVDTLRYFFSAIFQGIAAILTLGAMF